MLAKMWLSRGLWQRCAGKEKLGAAWGYPALFPSAPRTYQGCAQEGCRRAMLQSRGIFQVGVFSFLPIPVSASSPPPGKHPSLCPFCCSHWARGG